MFYIALIIFIFILSFLVLAHEFGHFIVAKRNHVRVEEFGIGFPPRIWSTKKHGTIYSINAIPLGGFVKLLGEENDVSHENSFSKRSPWVRAKIIFSGVLVNFILAWLLLTVWFLVVPAHMDNKIVVAEVSKNSSAAMMGIKSNDFILKINDQKLATAEELTKYTTEHQEQKAQVTIERFGKELVKEGVLGSGSSPLGIAMADIGGDTQKVAWYLAPVEAVKEMGAVVWLSALFIWNLIQSLFGGVPVPREAISGPVGVFAFLYQVISYGWAYLIRFAALISLSLAFFNLLPLPALDGGRLLFIALEGVRGKKVIKPEFENAIHWVGFLLLLALMVLITYNDIMKWVVNK